MTQVQADKTEKTIAFASRTLLNRKENIPRGKGSIWMRVGDREAEELSLG